MEETQAASHDGFSAYQESRPTTLMAHAPPSRRPSCSSRGWNRRGGTWPNHSPSRTPDRVRLAELPKGRCPQETPHSHGCEGTKAMSVPPCHVPFAVRE